MKIISRPLRYVNVSTDIDRVLIAMPLPEGSTLTNVWFNTHIVAGEEHDLSKATLYGMTAYVVPFIDPDTQVTYDTIWDQMVPKDVELAFGVFDLDPGTSDAAPVYGVGEVQVEAILGHGSVPIELFKRRKLLTAAAPGSAYQAVSSAIDKWGPRDFVASQIKTNIKVDVPSLFLLGFSSPTRDETTTLETTPNEQEWTLMTYIRRAVELAHMTLVGLTEAGATTPYLNAMTLIAKLLEPDYYTDSAGAIVSSGWHIWTQGSIELSIPDVQMPSYLTSE
jgi:hypothetical protein